MKPKNIKQKNTLMLQLYSLCTTNQHEVMAEDVNLEFEAMIDAEKIVKSPRLLSLVRVLHATRGLDTSLRLFLEINNHVPAQKRDHHLGGYIKQLQKPEGKFRQLDGNLANNAKRYIVDNRNTYMHVSNTYPTDGVCGFLISQILSLLNVVLTLK